MFCKGGLRLSSQEGSFKEGVFGGGSFKEGEGR